MTGNHTCETLNRHPGKIDGTQILCYQDRACGVVKMILFGLLQVCKDTPTDIMDVTSTLPEVGILY